MKLFSAYLRRLFLIWMMASMCLCLCAMVTLGHAARSIVVPDPKEKLAMPEHVAQAVEALLQATRTGGNVKQADLDAMLAFCVEHAMGTGSRIVPERPEGAGVFYYRPMPFSLSQFISYAMNPKIPGAALSPNSVRRNAWQGGDLLKVWNRFTATPENLLVAHGQEYEQITPDETSGSYYAYTLKRLFAVMPSSVGKTGKAALFMISLQDGESENGLKGAILGKDERWNYVYTGVQGSTLPMVGWAETHVYSTATISLWVEPEAGTCYVYMFKWLKAGWNGMNVVKTSHINTGVTRYLSGLIQVLGSAQRPTPDAIVARTASIAAMSDAEQVAALNPYGRELERLAKEYGVNGEDFDKILKDGVYASHLTREEREAELIKLFMKEQLGMPLPTGYHSETSRGAK